MEEKVRKRLLSVKRLHKYLAYVPEQSAETTEIKCYLQMDPGKIAQMKMSCKHDARLAASSSGGILESDREAQTLSYEAGDSLWVCGYPALSGSLLLARHHREELEDYFPHRFLSGMMRLEQQVSSGLELQQDARSEFETLDNKQKAGGIAAVYPLGEGGLRRTIYEVGKDTGLGFRIYYEAIAMKQECIEICEFFDLDPWELASWGAFLVVAKRGWNPQQIWKNIQIPCNRVGYLTKEKEKLIVSNAGESGINRPGEDGLLRVLKRYC